MTIPTALWNFRVVLRWMQRESNAMTDIALGVLLLIAIGTGIVHLIQRDNARNRADTLQAQLDVATQRLNATETLLRRQGYVVDGYLAAAALMHKCNIELERRNFYLEARRYVILRRWWRRSPRRPLVQWQVGKAGGA
jgi:hypothetical protein